MFCCTLLYVHSSFAIILMGKRELVALLSLSSWCLEILVWLFLAMSWVCLQLVIVVFPDHTHLLFLFLLVLEDNATISKLHSVSAINIAFEETMVFSISAVVSFHIMFWVL